VTCCFGRLTGQDVFDQILDGGIVFGFDLLMLFLDPVNFNGGRGGQMGEQFDFAVSLALVLGRRHLECRTIFFLVYRMALGALVGQKQRFSIRHVHGLGLHRQRSADQTSR
jgi:hypothetical protein